MCTFKENVYVAEDMDNKSLRVSGRSRHTLIQMRTYEPCFSSHLIGAHVLSHTIKGNTQCTRLRTLNWGTYNNNM